MIDASLPSAPALGQCVAIVADARIYELLRSLNPNDREAWLAEIGPPCSGCQRPLEGADYFTGCVFQVGDLSLCHDCAHTIVRAFSYKHGGRAIPCVDQLANAGDVALVVRQRVYARDRFTCRYCGTPGGILTLDHIIPGKNHQPWNLATACQSCNSRKGARTPEQANMPLLAVGTVRGA